MVVTGGVARRYWASGPDQRFAGLRYVLMFGDLEVPAPSELRAALSAIAAAGTHTRVGLTPETGRRVWTYDSSAPLPVYQLPDRVVTGGTAEVLQCIRGQREAGDPMEVYVSPRLIAFHADHGIGDGRFVLELLSSLFALSGGRNSSWVTNNDTPLALPRALFRTFGIHPARARRAWKYAAGLRSACAGVGDFPRGSESVAWAPSFAVTVAHVDVDAESEVNEWRRAYAQSAGSGAVWLYIVRQALRAAGLQIADTVIVAFDCHRHLPERFTLNGNFIVGLEIPITDDETLPALSARLRGASASAVPLAAIGAVSGRALLRPGRKPPTPDSHIIGAPANVMYTDMGNITSLDHLPWTGQDRRFTGLPDPAGPESITILNTRIGSARNISISFHDNVFDRRVIDRAADYLTHPIRLLRSTPLPPA